MLSKNKPIKPEEHDFTVLDRAVSELSKQTSALLGSDHEDKATKPTLPKKNAQLKSKAKSFDIIHSPAQSKPAVLKTAAVSRPKIEEPEAEFLPENASLSFNEKHIAASPVQSGVKEASLDDKSSVITTHKASMMTAPVHPDEAVETLAHVEEPEARPEPPTPAEPEVSLEIEQPVQTSGGIKFKADQKTEESEPQSEPEVLAQKPSEVKKEAKDETNPEETPEAIPSYESAGVYANNLVKNKAPKGYEPRDSQLLPTVFDTNEYHEELHDWSKLSNGSGSKLILLLLLVVVAGAIAYFVISGQQLPF